MRLKYIFQTTEIRQKQAKKQTLFKKKLTKQNKQTKSSKYTSKLKKTRYTFLRLLLGLILLLHR